MLTRDYGSEVTIREIIIKLKNERLDLIKLKDSNSAYNYKTTTEKSKGGY